MRTNVNGRPKPYMLDSRAWRLVRSVYGKWSIRVLKSERVKTGASLRVAVARIARTIRSWERS